MKNVLFCFLHTQDLGVELFSVSPEFKTPTLPLITENWELSLKAGETSPCLYDWTNYQCAFNRDRAVSKSVHPCTA
jgi:hypothetical protein